jgi:hypothetical protein
MIDANGRYRNTPTLMDWTADGAAVPYLARRFLPKVCGHPVANVTVAQGMRLDLIAFRWCGDATRSWEIADANQAMDPFDLTAKLGRTLVVAQPNP